MGFSLERSPADKGRALLPPAERPTMKNILIVDDSAPIRSILTRLITRCGVGVGALVEASNGEEARTCLENDESIDLVLVDQNMPREYGTDLVLALRERHPERKLQLWLMTHFGDTAIQEESGAWAADGVLHKPFGTDCVRALLLSEDSEPSINAA